MANKKPQEVEVGIRRPDITSNISALKKEGEKFKDEVGVLGSTDEVVLKRFNQHYDDAAPRHQNLYNRVYSAVDNVLTPELNRMGGAGHAQDSFIMFESKVYDELTGGYVNVEVVDQNQGIYKDGLIETTNIDYISKIYKTRRDNLTDIELIPLARALRSGDTGTVGGLNAIVTSQSRKSGFRDVMAKAVDPAFRYGSGIVHGYFNPRMVDIVGGHGDDAITSKTATGKKEFLGDNYWFTEGSVVMEVINNYNYFSDPAATSVDNARYHIIYKKTTVETLIDQKILNTDQLKDLKGLGLVYNGSSTSYNGEDNMNRDYTTGVKNVCDLYIYYTRAILPAKVNPTKKDEVVYVRHYILGKSYIAKTEILNTKTYPIWVYNVESLDNEILGTCAVIKLMPIQKLIQQLDNAIIFATAHAAVPQRVINTEIIDLDGDDLEEYINQPGIFFKSDGDVRGAIQWLELPSLPADIYQFKLDLINYMDTYEGITPAYSGQNVGSVQGTGGVNSLINRALAPDNALIKRWQPNFRNMCEWFIETVQESLSGYDVNVDIPDPDIQGIFKKVNMLNAKKVPYNVDYYMDYGRDKSMETQYEKIKEIFTVVMEHTQEPNIPLLTETLRLSGIQAAPDLIQRLWEDTLAQQKEQIKNGIFQQGRNMGVDVSEEQLELIASEVMAEKERGVV